MSRALNLSATQADVIQTCTKHKAVITAIETLRSGGTRVVLSNADDAAIIGKAFGAKVITGPVSRTPDRLMHG
jgi:hypothetical protein